MASSGPGPSSTECVGEANDYAWFGTETHVYDFGKLGTFELSGIGRTTFDVVRSDYRWHEHTGSGLITAGTGAFANAQGMFDLNGYTRWVIDESGPPSGYGLGLRSTGRVHGLALIPEPSGIALVSVAALTLLGKEARRVPASARSPWLSPTVLPKQDCSCDLERHFGARTIKMSFRTNSILSVVLGAVRVLPLVLVGAGIVNAQLVVDVDDFNDGNDNGWTHFDYTEGESFGPALFEVSNGAYHIASEIAHRRGDKSTRCSRCGR